jgi:predicted nucleic acid-binding protein
MPARIKRRTRASRPLVILHISIPDGLIAPMTLSRGARLYTFNLKHFRAVPNLDVQVPHFRQSQV